ncbi:MAG: YHS domain-containing (seleno)protein [Xanthobacteraceae bacterium]
MTAARRQRKPWVHTVPLGLGTVLLLMAGPPFLRPAQASTTERVVVDPHRGLALNGFDPVAYFSDGKAMMGRGEFEYRFAGAIWRFRNEGNRAAFMKDPEIYAPAFGGYDPVAVARGVAAAGHPQIWTIIGERLYLFYSPDAREAFSASPEGMTAAAERKWPAVLRSLGP